MSSRRYRRGGRRALTLSDLVAGLAVSAVAVAIAVPALGRLRGVTQVDASLSNLAVMGMAAQLYAADWNGRQYTTAVDNLGQLGSNAEVALLGYEQVTGEPHPGILLGWGYQVPGKGYGMWGFFFQNANNAEFVAPIEFEGAFGSFRFANAKGFHDYVGGRWFDDRFYAPADTFTFESAEPFFTEPPEFLSTQETGGFIWSSYCFSPAAMFDPAVMRASTLGGFQAPFSLADGLRSPPLASALFPDLKTHIMEHHWNQGPPAECNPAWMDPGEDDCEPFYFNHGITSMPATLFYDGHVRLLPNSEVQAADQQMLKQTGGLDGLWSRDTPLGVDGYFLDLAFDSVVDVSHHVLTTGGIQGRDTAVTSGLTTGMPDVPRTATRGFLRPFAFVAPPPIEGIMP